jgi:hypothetical protein
MQHRFGILVAAAVLLTATTSRSATIGFDPDPASVGTGETLAVDLIVSDLGGEVVSAYDLDILYDPAILTPTVVAFRTGLGDLLAFEALADADIPAPGVLDLASVSLLGDAELLALQGGDAVTLSTIQFQALSDAETTLDFRFDQFNDVKGLNNGVLEIVADPLAVNPPAAVIPEPTAALTFGLGLLITRASIRRGRRAS